MVLTARGRASGEQPGQAFRYGVAIFDADTDVDQSHFRHWGLFKELRVRRRHDERRPRPVLPQVAYGPPRKS